jgi:hypothetical protein
MMDSNEIIEALESTSGNRRDRGGISDPRMPDAADIRLWRDRLLRFFEDLDAEVTVSEIVEALEDYT